MNTMSTQDKFSIQDASKRGLSRFNVKAILTERLEKMSTKLVVGICSFLVTGILTVLLSLVAYFFNATKTASDELLIETKAIAVKNQEDIGSLKVSIAEMKGEQKIMINSLKRIEEKK